MTGEINTLALGCFIVVGFALWAMPYSIYDLMHHPDRFGGRPKAVLLWYSAGQIALWASMTLLVPLLATGLLPFPSLDLPKDTAIHLYAGFYLALYIFTAPRVEHWIDS